MKQLTITDAIIEAERLKARGIKRSVTHADKVNPDWSDRAYAYCLRYLENKAVGFHFLSENIRVMAEADFFPVPPSRRAWAAVILKVAKSGLIASAGISKVSNPKCHGAFVTQWRKVK